MPVADLRAVRRALADLIFGDEPRRRAACAAMTERDAWADLIALAERWKLTPQLAEALPGEMLQPRLRETLQSGRIAVAVRTARTLRCSSQVTALLAARGIPSAAFKGIALVLRLYGRPAGRAVGDLDVIVAPADARRAEAVLLEAGFTSRDPAFETHVAQISASPHLHNFARTFARDGFEVDLHWQFGLAPPAPLAAERLLSRASLARIGKDAVSAVAPIDAMLLTAHHALRESFPAGATLKDAADLAAWWTLAPQAFAVDDLLDAALEAHLATTLAALWRIVATRDPHHPARAGIAAFERRFGGRACREARRLHRFCERQLAEGDRAARSVELFAPRLLLASATRRVSDTARGTERMPQRAVHVRLAGAVRRIGRVARDLLALRSLPELATVARNRARFR